MDERLQRLADGVPAGPEGRHQVGLDGDPLADRPPAGGDLLLEERGDLVDQPHSTHRRGCARLRVIHPMIPSFVATWSKS